jgi:hypothetical protein
MLVGNFKFNLHDGRTSLSSECVKKISIICVTILLLISNPLPLQNSDKAFAQSVKLIVSAAQDPAQQNHFFGPQIVQITIDDPGARDPDTSTSGLFVRGLATQRVHLADGQWYAFIADDDSFLVFLDVITDGSRDGIIAVSDGDDADNRNTIGSFNVQFNSADSFVREITDVGGSTFVEVRKDALFTSLPDPFIGTAVNPDLDINASTEASVDWPYIRLVSIQETDIVDIRLAATSVNLTFNSFFDNIQLGLDRESYPLNSEITINFKDFMWNINPVEEDVVRFALDKNTGRPLKLIYQPLRNFDPQGNGLNLVDILSIFTLLEFDQRQVLEVDGVGNMKYKQALDNTLIEFPEETGRLIDSFTTGQLPLITFFEKDPNTSIFETIDESQGGRSKIFAGKRDATASIDYFDIIDTVVTGVHDAFASVDKEIYDSGDRAMFTITDTDLNTRSNISEEPDGILSKTFVMVGTPFPVTNNALANTLPKDLNGNFVTNSIREARFVTVGPGVEVMDFDQNGVNDFFASSGAIEDLTPSKTDFFALDFTTDNTSGTSGASPTGLIINTNVRLGDIDDVIKFAMTKSELQTTVDPFVLAVSKLTDRTNVGTSFPSAAATDVFDAEFPKFNLIHVDLQKIRSTFAKVFVEITAMNGANEVAGSAQIVDFEPFDPDDVDGNPFTKSIDPLTDTSGIGSFKVLDLIAALPANANLNDISLKFTVIIADSANQPLPLTPSPLTSVNHQAVLDIVGFGIIRAQISSKDNISVNAFENFVYRLGLDEQGENSSIFTGRADFMTALHSDTVQKILQEVVTIGDPLKIWMPHRFIPPNRLVLSFTDLDISGAFRQVSSTFIYETRDAVISWDREQYRFNTVAFLTLVDEDLNRKPDAVEQYAIPQDGFVFFELGKLRADTQCQNVTPMQKECFARYVEATLRETGSNTAIFKAQITMPERVLLEDGSIIRTLKSDIQANYVDVRDSSSNVKEFDTTAAIRSDIDTTPVQSQPSPEAPAVVERGSTKLELDKGNYHPYDRVMITITAPEGNVDTFRSDVIFISVKRQSAATGITSYKLVETGANTAVFTGYIDLQGRTGTDGGNGPKDGTLKIDVGDTLNIDYAALTANAPIQYHEGKVFWDKTKYVIGETAKLQIIDTDMNKSADRIDVIHTELLIGNAKLQVDLRESGVDTGTFAGEIHFVNLDASTKEGEVEVKSGDAVTLVYNDETAPLALIQAAGLPGNILPVKSSVTVGDVMELVGTNRIEQKEAKLIDESGKEVSRAKIRDSYKIESEVQNKTGESVILEFIVQVKDEHGITQFLEHATHNVGSGESITPTIEWQTTIRGKYTFEIFVWQNPESPSPLSQVGKFSIIVE